MLFPPFHRLDFATRSSSSFFCKHINSNVICIYFIMKPTLMAYELDEPLAALMSSSARHSAIDLTLRKADSRVYSIHVISIFTAPQKKGDSTYTSGNESNSLVDSAKR